MRERTPLVFLLLALAAPAQAPLLQTRLEGLVIDPLERPVANAEVTVEHDGVEIASTRSDGLGAFVFPRVPAQFVVVRARTDTPDIGAVLVDLWGNGRGFATVRTGPARRVSGVVRDDTGAPVDGAFVAASPVSGADLAYATCSTTADRNGRYELTHVPMGIVHLRVWTALHDADGVAAEIDGTEDATHDWVVNRDRAEYRIVILESATPEQLERAELRVVASNSGAPIPLPPELTRPRSTEPGKWELTGWSRDDAFHTWIVLDGACVWPALRTFESGIGTARVRFAFGEEDCEVRGTLRDADGKPSGGTRLLVQPLTSDAALNCLRRIAETDEHGAFRCQSPVLPGEQFAMRSTSRGTILVGNDANPVWYVGQLDVDDRPELTCRRSHSVRVPVLDTQGSPAPGAPALLFSASDFESTLVGGGTTGLDGWLDVQCLALGQGDELRLDVLGAGGTGSIQFRVADTLDMVVGPLRLAPAGTLAITAQKPGGEVAPGARVAVCYPGGDVELIAADRDGRIVRRGMRAGQVLVWPVSTTGPTNSARAMVDDGVIAEVKLIING